MNKGGLLLTVVFGFLAGLAGVYFAPMLLPASSSKETISVKESAYDRVMRTQTIRCGYAVWPPSVIKDPNTGALSGIMYDYVEALGAALHLKIDWAEEVGWGDFPASLEAGRIDSFCVGAWPNAARARQMDFAEPIFYQPLYAYARIDDNRFDNNLDAINNDGVIAATIDGEMSSMIAAKDFPKTKTLQLPQLSSPSESLLSIVDKKADVAFTDPITVGDFSVKNQNKLKRIPSKMPLRVFGVSMTIPRGQEEFRRMLNISTTELLSSGQIEKILAKYEQYPGTLLRVSPTYIPQ